MKTRQPLRPMFDEYLETFASDKSYRVKLRDLVLFLGFLQQGKRTEPVLSDWTPRVTGLFLAAEKDRGMSPATLARRYATLHHAGRQIALILAIPHPMRGLRKPSVPKRTYKQTPSHEIGAWRRAIDIHGRTKFHRARNRFMYELAGHCGSRASEWVSIQMEQIDWSCRVASGVLGKNDDYVDIYLSPALDQWLEPYLELRARVLPRDSGPLFCTSTGKQLTYQGVRNLWRKIGDVVKSQRRAHSRRHDHALALQALGAKPGQIMQALNHSSLISTSVYLTDDIEDIRQIQSQIRF